jgi:hypothetical protein
MNIANLLFTDAVLLVNKNETNIIPIAESDPYLVAVRKG